MAANRFASFGLVYARDLLFVTAIGMLFWVLIDPHTNPPDLSSGTAALAVGALGTAVNPKTKQVRGPRRYAAFFISSVTASLVIVSAIWLILYDTKVAASVFAASLAAVAGLSIDTSSYVFPNATGTGNATTATGPTEPTDPSGTQRSLR